MEWSFKKMLWVNVGVIGGSAAALFVAFYFLAGDIEKVVDEVSLSRKAITQQSLGYERLASLKSEAGEARALREKLQRVLPPQEKLLDFPQYLDTVARTHGVGLSFSFQGSPAPSAESQAGYIATAITISGPLAGIHSFINDLEFLSIQFLTSIDSVDVVGVEEGYRADVRGRVFFK